VLVYGDAEDTRFWKCSIAINLCRISLKITVIVAFTAICHGRRAVKLWCAAPLPALQWDPHPAVIFDHPTLFFYYFIKKILFFGGVGLQFIQKCAPFRCVCLAISGNRKFELMAKIILNYNQLRYKACSSYKIGPILHLTLRHLTLKTLAPYSTALAQAPHSQ
jgi:hypothetical protein